MAVGIDQEDARPLLAGIAILVDDRPKLTCELSVHLQVATGVLDLHHLIDDAISRDGGTRVERLGRMRHQTPTDWNHHVAAARGRLNGHMQGRVRARAGSTRDGLKKGRVRTDPEATDGAVIALTVLINDVGQRRQIRAQQALAGRNRSVVPRRRKAHVTWSRLAWEVECDEQDRGDVVAVAAVDGRLRASQLPGPVEV